MRLPEQRILIVDDDVSFRKAVSDLLTSKSRKVLGVGTGREAISVCAEDRMDVILLDQHLPDGLGMDFCKAILQHQERSKVVFITAHANVEDAVLAVSSGAFDYLSKPIELTELELVVERAMEAVTQGRLASLQRLRQDQETAEASLVTFQHGLDRIRPQVEQAAQNEANVLITGETGTGKTFLARAIHYLGARSRAPFVSVNCAALPANLAESDIFGHEKGAFTGAARARRGVFEMANGGTLLLDEVGAMDITLQTKLLGVIEERRVQRVGGEHAKPVDVRIIAATNADLESPNAAQVMRRDLYYRLNVLRIPLPPLRERLEDIPMLCGIFLDQLTSPGAITLSDEELRRLQAYSWPGNIRELRNILERAVSIQPLSALRPSVFLLANEASLPVGDEPLLQVPINDPKERILSLKDLERKYILTIYERFQHNLAQTARLLVISESTLRRKLRRYLAESSDTVASGRVA